ncbi:hypothetical protein BGZ63DRAFT_357049 [Mariannaea sp. PMI_226]|nr:hypothetical protein BGZ63DRAFT_357049 [Mariannaea sp. PMI_226]
MRLSQVSHDTWLCKPCNTLFSSREKLHEHKGIMRAAGKPKHVHCKFCSEDFKTERAEILHIQEKHPQEQNLECPACRAGPFVRLGGLMDHIENHCIRLDSATLAEMRDQKLEFSKRLEALTQHTVKKNYSDYMPPASGNGQRGRLVDRSPSQTPSTNGEPPRGRSRETKIITGTSPQWQLDSKKPQESESTVARAVYETLDANHPDHPGFSTARYFSGIIDEFVCPKAGCGKTFKKARGLVAHLRSATGHFGNIFRCPYCQRTFGSLTAVTMHAESSTVRCQIRETDDYNAYLDQLTAGIVNVAHGRHEDGTPKYETTEMARNAFGRRTGTVPGTNEWTEKKEYWDGKEIHW